jgi:hypothetical protein
MYYIIFELILREIYENNIQDICKFVNISSEFYNHIHTFLTNDNLLSKKLHILINNSTFPDKGLEIVVKHNYQDLIDYYVNNGATLWIVGIKAAAESGNMDLIHFFIQKSFDELNNSLFCKFNDPNWKYWYIHNNKYIANSGLLYGAKGGHKNIVEFFINNGADALLNAKRAAQYNNHLELVNYLDEKFIPNSI